LLCKTNWFLRFTNRFIALQLTLLTNAILLLFIQDIEKEEEHFEKTRHKRN